MTRRVTCVQWTWAKSHHITNQESNHFQDKWLLLTMSVRGVYSHFSIVILTKFKTNHTNTTLWVEYSATSSYASYFLLSTKQTSRAAQRNSRFKIKVLQRILSSKHSITSSKWLTDNINSCLSYFVTVLCRPRGDQSINGFLTLINSFILKFWDSEFFCQGN